ncbi:MAG TPA: tetraacyldisaccharide 4'-kinase [Candidatus Kapabacteria bacterium]|nr:tetraacyldisaccharide 4'-kinase [Candidatus Kapabacteria bacterium]
MLIDLVNPYAWGMWVRRRLYRRGFFRSDAVSIPVISVGNLSSGGTGKTPLAIYLALLIEQKYHKRVAIVLRGYKRKSNGLLVVRDSNDIYSTLDQSGDEAMLYAQELQRAIVLCDEDRLRGAQKAAELGAEVVILDDGFQHMRIRRDLNILLINEDEDIPAVIPFGKGRETISAANDADIIMITNWASSNWQTVNKPVVFAATKIESFEEIVPQKHFFELPELKNKTVLAVSGIGNPGSFENSIRPFFRNVIPLRFRDHTMYDRRMIAEIETAAAHDNCDLVITTTKDELKLLSLVQEMTIAVPLVVVRSRTVISRGEDILHNAIESIFSANT